MELPGRPAFGAHTPFGDAEGQRVDVDSAEAETGGLAGEQGQVGAIAATDG